MCDDGLEIVLKGSNVDDKPTGMRIYKFNFTNFLQTYPLVALSVLYASFERVESMGKEQLITTER